MKVDDLYLGYYLHLIQDILYRHFIYDRYHLPSMREENHDLEKLYDDYRQINAYVIENYKLTKDIPIPADFEKERMNEIAVFDPRSLLKEYQKDFEPVDNKPRFFFTDSMVDEYIQWAADYCGRELGALNNGSYYFDEYEWSWGI